MGGVDERKIFKHVNGYIEKNIVKFTQFAVMWCSFLAYI